MYFFMGRVKTEKNKEGYAISTIERKLSVITGALEMALKDRMNKCYKVRSVLNMALRL